MQFRPNFLLITQLIDKAADLTLGTTELKDCALKIEPTNPQNWVEGR